MQDLRQSTREACQRLLEPLCDETRRIFRALSLEAYDRLVISLSSGKARHFLFKIYGRLNDGRTCWPSYEASVLWVNRLPELVKDRTGSSSNPEGWPEFVVASTDFTALVVNALWPPEQIEFGSAEAKALYGFLLARFLRQTMRSEGMERSRLKGPPVFEHEDSATFPLTGYQRIALVGCMFSDGFGLFMEQGTGKTPVVIARICNEALTSGDLYRAIIVCPKNVRANWQKEFEKFATVPGKVAVLRGTQVDRVKLLIEAMAKEDGCGWSAVVCSYEMVGRSWNALRLIPWDLAVADESHFIKSPGAARSKRMLKLRDISKARMCLTGTPVTNSGAIDLFTQLEFLGEGLSGFRSLERFRRYYARWIQVGPFRKFESHQNMPLIQERLVRVSFSIDKKTAMPDLPGKLYGVLEVRMTPEQQGRYVELRDRLVLEIKDSMDREANGVLAVNNALVKLLRLGQITSGFLVLERAGETVDAPERSVYKFDPNPKVEALMDLIKDSAPNEKFVVWACWVQDIKTIGARADVEGISCETFYGATNEEKRARAVDRFNTDPSCKVFLGNPAAAGFGLNLLGYDYSDPSAKQKAQVHVVYFSQNWSMVYRIQSEDRCHRWGTRMPVKYTDLSVPNTVDEEIREHVRVKRASALEVQDVKGILDRLVSRCPE